MKKALVVLLFVVIATGSLFAGGAQEGDDVITVGYTFHGAADVFQNTLKNEFVAAAEELGMKVNVIDPNLDTALQVAAIETFVSQQVDVIAISPLDSEALVPSCQDAIAAGIPVVGVNSELNFTDPMYSYVGSVNYEAGLQQAEYMIDRIPEGGKVVYLEGTPGMEHSIARKAAVMENLIDKRPDLELLASQTADYRRDLGMSVMEDFIQAFPQIDAVVAANDQMILGAIEALKGADRLEGVLTAGIDGTPGARNSIKAGELTMSVVQDAIGQATEGARISKMMAGGEGGGKRYIIPFYPIDASNPDD